MYGYTKLKWVGMSLLGGLLLGASSTHAIVNIEDMRSDPAQDGWSGNLQFGINGDSGNTDKMSASLGGIINWRKSVHTAFLAMSRDYGESQSVKDKDRAFAHLRYIHEQNAFYAWETFTQFQRDEFKRLERRTLLGAGGRFRLARSDSMIQVLGTGLFYSTESYDNSVVPEQRDEDAWRANIYWVVKWQANENVKLANTVYLQPKFSELNDVRIADQFSINVKMTGALALQIGMDLSYDSDPPDLEPGTIPLKRHDVNYRTVFVYEF